MSMGRTSKYETTSFTAEKPNTWKCGIYLRLSREDGDKMESDSIINQRKIIDRYLEKNQDIDILTFIQMMAIPAQILIVQICLGC